MRAPQGNRWQDAGKTLATAVAASSPWAKLHQSYPLMLELLLSLAATSRPQLGGGLNGHHQTRSTLGA